MPARFHRLLFAALFLQTLHTFAAPSFRLAVMHSDERTADGIKHADEFDLVADRLGWDKTLFAYSDFPRLAKELEKFDMIAGAPLFFGDGSAFSQHSTELRDFVVKGGAIIVPEANYPAATAWLEKVDPRFKSYGNGRDSRQWPKEGPFLSKPPHPLYFLPNSKLPNEEVTAWGDLELDEKLGWEVALRSGNGKPSTALNRLEKGIVYVSNQRQGNVATFENLRATLELQRIGLQATSFSMPGIGFENDQRGVIAVGAGEITLELKPNEAKNLGPVALDFEIIPETGKPLKFRKSANLTASPVELKLPYRASLRGKAKAILSVQTKEGTATIFDRTVELPPFLTVLPPRYRGTIAASRKAPVVEFGVKIARDQEALGGARLHLKIESSTGTRPLAPVEFTPTKLEFSVSVKLGDLPPGDYTAMAELRKDSTLIGEAKTPFKVLAPTPNQVVVDDDLNLLVDGKPFFPIGIYHTEKEDLPVIASLGFNSIQGWEWGFQHGRDVLDAAQQNGLKVLLEMGNIRRRHHEIPALIREFKEHPALLAWYVFDEPQEPDFLLCSKIRDMFRDGDPDHPAFILSFLPHLFQQQQALGDIFAVDPYPLPNPVLTQVTDWGKRAVKDTAGEKPVWLVNQSFGPETPEQLRAMAYLSLASGARGIFWYPWDDGAEQKKGLKYHPQLHASFKSLTAEIKELSPMLLGWQRKEISSADGKIHGLLLTQGKKGCLLVVNAGPDKAEATFEIPAMPTGARIQPRHNGEELRPSSGKAKISLGPYETRDYRW